MELILLLTRRAKVQRSLCLLFTSSLVQQIEERSKKKIRNQIYIIPVVLRRVTSDEAHLCGLAPGQLNSEETSQQWRADGDTMFDLTGRGIEHKAIRTGSDSLTQHQPAGKMEPIYEITAAICLFEFS